MRSAVRGEGVGVNGYADPNRGILNRGRRPTTAVSIVVVLSLLALGAPAASAAEAPSMPTFVGSNPASPANDNIVRILGSAPAGSTVALYSNPLCEGAPAAMGSAAEFASPGLAVSVANNTTTTFHATATDGPGVASECSTDSFRYVEDSTDPEPPVFIGSSPASPADDTSPAIRGSAEAGASVDLFANATCTGAPVASGSSQSFFSPGLTVTVPNDSRTSFWAIAEDRAGNVSVCSSPFVYTEDSTGPAGSSAPDLTASSDTGLSSTDNVTKDVTPTFTGTAEAGATVRLFVRGVLVGSAIAWDGSYTINVVEPLSSGAYDAAVQATDLAGNVGTPSSALAFLVDTVAPEMTLGARPRDRSGDATPGFSFWASEPGVSYECSLSAGTPSFSACASPLTYSTLADGRYTFAVWGTDRAGNTGSREAYDFEIDSTLTPTVAAPTHTLALDSQLGTTSVPVEIRWSGEDPDGISRYELQQSSDGGQTYSNVSLASERATSRTVHLGAGDKLYRFRIRATDLSGDISEWVEGSAFSLRTYGETSVAIDFDGLWTKASLSKSLGGSVRYSTLRPARMTLPFTGSRVAWIAERNSNRGKAEVWLDGVKVATVDLYSPTRKPRRVVFSRAVSPGAHELQVRVLGQRSSASSGARVDVDALVVVQ
jgi:hypothetical protein